MGTVSSSLPFPVPVPVPIGIPMPIAAPESVSASSSASAPVFLLKLDASSVLAILSLTQRLRDTVFKASALTQMPMPYRSLNMLSRMVELAGSTTNFKAAAELVAVLYNGGSVPPSLTVMFAQLDVNPAVSVCVSRYLFSPARM